MESPATTGFWLSPQQRHVWSLQQVGRAYRSVCLAVVEGIESSERLSSALERLVARHEILRTVYLRQPGMLYPFQVILEGAAPSLECIDCAALPASEQASRLDSLFQQEQVRSIGPERLPALKATFVVLGSGRHAVILSTPAISADRYSLHILIKELEESVNGGSATNELEPLRYVQFAQWQNDLLEGDNENAVEGREYWKAHTDAVASLAIPNERKPKGDFSPQVWSCELDSATFAAVEAVAARLKASNAEVVLAAWQSLLYRITGQTSFHTGVVFDGRDYEELRNTVGPIARTIPIRARFDGDFLFREVADHVRSTVHDAAEWQEYYVPGSGFDADLPVSFEYWTPRTQDSISRLSSSTLRVFDCQDGYKLKLLTVRQFNRLQLEFHYDGSRFENPWVQQLAGYFQRLLAAGAADPETHVSRLPLLDEAERHRLLVEWNQTTAEYPRDQCLHELFEAQVAQTPDRAAVRCNGNALTYRELNDQANQIAHFLRTQRVGPNSRVGLCMERSVDMLAAMLGIIKAGGAYVPLNSDHPKPRLSQQLAGAVVLITQQDLLGQMPGFAGKILCLDRDSDLWRHQPRDNPAKNSTPDDLIYVIYTSGSTGVPKGVAVRHRNLVNYSQFIIQRLGLSRFREGLDFATVSTIGADLGNTCIFPALISGGCLHIVSHEDSTDPLRMARYMSQHPVDVLKIVPSHLQTLLQSAEARQLLPRKFLILGGEVLTSEVVEKIESLGADCELLNHYGPTETTVGSLTLRLADYDWRNSPAASIPIGRPIANTQIYILDNLLQPVPTGAVGELYIAGDGVAAGYLDQPDRTAERFIPNPLVDGPQLSMYRTGDLARYLPDGNVEFLGRSDDQIKIRGFRIELGEIESVLMAKSGVKQAVVVARDDARGDKRLVAYAVVDRDQNSGMEELRAHLKHQLPDYMLPSALVLLPKIPLTPNGKIDRQALPQPESVATAAYSAPTTPAEEALANIWGEVLRRERISIDDNFFDLGGHSLLATLVVSRIREQFRIELPIRVLFDSPTIRSLAAAVANSGTATPLTQEPAIVRVSRDAYRAGRN